MEKAIRAVAAAENTGDQKAAAALMTDAGIAAFYQGTTRADLEAGRSEGFGEDPPTIQKVTVVKDDADSGTVTVVVTIGTGYALQTVQIAMVKQGGAWLADGLTSVVARRSLAGRWQTWMPSTMGTSRMVISHVGSGLDPVHQHRKRISRTVVGADSPRHRGECRQGRDLEDGPQQTVRRVHANRLPRLRRARVPIHGGQLCEGATNRPLRLCVLRTLGGVEGSPPHLSQGMIHDFTVI